MKPLVRLLLTMFKNGVKQALKKPMALIGYLVFFGLILYGFLSFFTGDREVGRAPAEIYIAIVTVFCFITVIPSLVQGMSVGGFNFRMADVNLVFTSPLSPGRILLYSQIRQAGTSVFVGLLMLIQAPLLKLFFDISIGGMVIYVTAWIILLFTLSFFSLFMYTLFGKRERARKVTKYILYAGCVAFGAYIIGVMLRSPEPLSGLLSAMSADFVKFIPIVGWYQHLFVSALHGFSWDFFWPLAVILLFSIFTGHFSLKLIQMDYYEDAIGTAETIEKAYASARKGESDFSALSNSKKRVRKIKHHFSMRGAGAIFQKHLLEYRKKGFYFINVRTIFIVAVPLIAAYFIPLFEYPEAPLLTALAASVYLALIIAFQGNWNKELQKPYVYLIPDNAMKKLLLCTGAENIKHFIDGLILFIVAAAVFGASAFIALLCAMAYTVTIAMFTFMDILSQRLFGRLHSKVLGSYLKVIATSLIIVPGIVISIILLETHVPVILSLAALIGCNLFFAAFIAFFAAGAFKYPEVNQ